MLLADCHSPASVIRRLFSPLYSRCCSGWARSTCCPLLCTLRLWL